MRNKTIFRVAVCIIILLTFILPVSAQQPDKTNEYEVSLKKLMEVTGASASIDEVLSYTLSVAKMNASEEDADYWDTFTKSWREKIEKMVLEIYLPVYKKHLALDDLKGVISFLNLLWASGIKSRQWGLCAKPCRCWLVGYRWIWERNCVRKLTGVRR